MPLFCDLTNESDICVGEGDRNPIIYFKYALFTFSISFKLSIRNIDFNMIDLIYYNKSDNSCLFQNNSKCCEKISNNISEICSLQYIQGNFPEKGYNALFEIQMIINGINENIPILSFSNINFLNIFMIGQNSTYSGSLIKIDEYGAQITLRNISMKNFYFQGFILAFNPTQKTSSNTNNSYLIFINFNLDNGNFSGDSFLKKNQPIGYFHFINFDGAVVFHSIKFQNFLSLDSNLYLIYLQNLTKTIEISNIFVNNVAGISLIYGSSSKLFIYKFFVESFIWKNNALIFFDSSIVLCNFSLSDSNTTLSYSAMNTNIFFLFSQFSSVYVNFSVFWNLSSFSFSSVNSLLLFNSTDIINLNMRKFQINCIAS